MDFKKFLFRRRESGPTVKVYRIGGRVYTQRPLVLGQWRQLVSALGEIVIDPAGGLKGVLYTLLNDGRLEKIAAILLTPKGQKAESKKPIEIEEHLTWALDGLIAAEVLEDFFTCNPVALMLEKLTGAIPLLLRSTATGSNSAASSSPMETSPDETPSYGESPPPCASHGSRTGGGNTCSEKP